MELEPGNYRMVAAGLDESGAPVFLDDVPPATRTIPGIGGSAYFWRVAGISFGAVVGRRTRDVAWPGHRQRVCSGHRPHRRRSKHEEESLGVPGCAGKWRAR